jgi:hypothetical protein
MTRRIKSIARMLWLAALALIFGCQLLEPRSIAAARSLSFDELKQTVARIRGLSFQREVAVAARDSKELQALVENSILEEQGRESLDLRGALFARLGLLPEGIDFTKALAELETALTGAFPDAPQKTLLIPRQGTKPEPPLLAFPGSRDGETDRQIVQAHGLIRLLQEQHFRLGERLKRKPTEDAALAHRALRKGDAVLASLALLQEPYGTHRQRILDAAQAASGSASQIERDLAYLPEPLRRQAVFSTMEGLRFVTWAFSARGWEGVNSLYANPPASTKHILHPEKYYGKREEPVRITAWNLLRQFGDNKLLEETLGELLTQVLLGRTLSREEAASAAKGWAGDSLLAFRQDSGMAIAWITAWENREEAAEFFRSYRRALERRHNISLSAGPGTGDFLLTPRDSRRHLVLQIRGEFVFFLDGVEPPRSVEIAEDLWKDLETGADPVPYEITRRGLQRSPVRR